LGFSQHLMIAKKLSQLTYKLTYKPSHQLTPNE
jgi:hypothetical protein